MRQNFFDRKSCNCPFLNKNVRCPKLCDTMNVSPRNFLALWDKTLWQNRDDPSSVWKFRMPGLCWETERFPYEFFSSSETIFFDRTVMPSSSAWNFSVPGTFSKHKMVPLRFFLALWKKNKSTESRNAVPPFPPSKIIFPYQKFSETTNGSRMTFFSAVRQKILEKTVILPTIYQNLRCQFFSLS